MRDSLVYKLNSGKPNKLLFFIKGFAGDLLPDILFQKRLAQKLAKARARKDYEEIATRVDYYIKIKQPFSLSTNDIIKRERSWLLYRGCIGGFTRRMFHSAYYLDQRDVTKWFPRKARWSFCPGDVYFTPSCPTIVKSRLLTADNANSVLLKLDKLRHFMFVKDELTFRQKQNMAIFRGKIRQSRLRTAFLEQFFGHPRLDCGVVGRNEGCPEVWMQPKKTIREHLNYKFIMALEGNDVASNLKWVMSSNSLAVMTRPTCETWFMEGTLRAGVHYVEVKEDFSDLEEQMQHYIDYPDEAEEIIQNAHTFVKNFFDEEREELIQLLVMERYLQLSGQL